MLNMVAVALGWGKTPAFPNGTEENFQKAVGVFVKDGEPGFSGVDFQGLLAWEHRYGACPDLSTGEILEDEGNSCVDNCEGQAPDGCYCDEQCKEFGDCCPNYEEICNGAEPTEEPLSGNDFIARLIAAAKKFDQANPETPATLKDLIAAIKDRLITEPDMGLAEAKLISGLFGAKGIDTPLIEIENWDSTLRNYCGILLETPQFLLTGLAAPDQITAPAILVGKSDYESYCKSLSELLFSTDEYTVECGSDTLTIIGGSTEPDDETDPEPDP